MRRIASALACLVLALAPAGPAEAGGGSILYPVQDRYEPGDMATAVGYVSAAPGQGWLDDGPYFVYAEAGPNRRVPLGRIGAQPTRFGAAMVRVDLTFEVPDDLAPGHYALVTCNDRCAKGLGDLTGGTLHVGADPTVPVVRQWPPDEFEIVNLPDGARTAWPVTPPPAAIAPATAPTSVAPPLSARSAPLRAGPEANPAALVLGGALTAVFVGLVLVGLRDG